MRHINKEKSKVLNDFAENAKLEDFWSSIKSYIGFLTAGVGIATGAGMAAFGAYNGTSILPGVITTIGGFGSIGSQWMSDKKYNEKMVNALAIISSLAVGHSLPLKVFPESLTVKAINKLAELGVVEAAKKAINELDKF